MRREIPRIGEVRGELAAPASLSLTLQGICLAAMSSGPTTIRGALDMDDSRYLLEAIRTMGFDVSGTFSGGLTIGDRVSISAADVEIGAADARAAIPLLTGLLAFTPGRWILTGTSHPDELHLLVDALRSIGAEIEVRHEQGRLPLLIRGKRMRGGFEVNVNPRLPSSYYSALILSLPSLHGGIDFQAADRLAPAAMVSLRLAERFGAVSDPISSGDLRISGNVLGLEEYEVEGDFFGAATWLAAAAATAGRLTITSLPEQSVQPDAAIVSILLSLGCQIERRDGTVTLHATGGLRGGSIDCRGIDDLVPLLTLIAPSAASVIRFENLHDLEDREPQLLKVLTDSLERLGVTVRRDRGSLVVTPGWSGSAVELDASDDYRLAAAFAVGGLARGGVSLRGAEALTRSNPRFWRTFDELVRMSAG